MKLIIDKNRKVYSAGTWGTKNENNYEILDFEFPEELEEYNKRIVYYLDDKRVWDAIVYNKAYITNAITKYEKVNAYVWLTKNETITLKYVCDGTEEGNYYFTYDNVNYYFTMPEVEENDELIFDVATSTLKLDNTTIATTTTGTGTELTFETIIDAEEDFRTQLFEMQFYENENADGIVPTPEQVDGFNTMLTAMNNKITEIDTLETAIEGAEADRVLAEQGRVDTENTRVSNENTRQSNEQTRQTQEASREQRTNQAIAQITDMTEAYNQNAQQKTEAFNQNANNKTSDFDSNAESKTNTFNTNATQKTDAFNSNAESKTSTFNTNATNKTNDFNSNASSKTTAFNNNATSKTNTFNSNANDKTSAFNDNATQKTTNFDNNASSKTNDFNSNAASKTNDFNDNATAKTTAFNENALAKTEAFDEHTEDIQESLDDLAENMVEVTTEQATEITITDAARWNRNKIQIFGNTEQDSTSIAEGDEYDSPTPEHPQPIHVVTGNNTIKLSNANKNFFNVSNSSYSYGTLTFALTNNVINISIGEGSGGISQNSQGDYTNYDFDTTKDYYFSVYRKAGDLAFNSDTQYKWFRVVIYIKYSDDSISNNHVHITNGMSQESIKLTFTEGKTPVAFAIGRYSPSNTLQANQTAQYNVQLEEGSSATSYVPYAKTNYPFNLGNIELCKIGDYQDYIYKEDGNWYKYEAIRKVILTENSGNWTKGSLSNETYSVFQANFSITKYIVKTTNIFSDKFIAKINAEIQTLDAEGISTNGGAATSGKPIRISILNSRLTSVDANGFKLWLKDNNVTAYIPLYTPTSIQITDANLIAQLEQIYNHLALTKGTNNITITASDLAPYMKLSYRKPIQPELDDLQNQIDELTNDVDNEVENLQNQINDLNQEVSELSENMPWTETEQTTEIDITDAAKYSKNKMKVFGNTSQFSTTGKNLWGGKTFSRTNKGVTFELKSDGTIFANGTATNDDSYSCTGTDIANNTLYIVLPAGTYTCHVDNIDPNITAYQLYSLADGSTTATIISNTAQLKTFTLEETTNIGVRLRVNSGNTISNYTAKIMIESGSTATDYEPYTNNQPAPNPDYPQPIHVVTGNNTIGVTGKNVLRNDRVSITTKGVTFTVNSDGSITAIGTSTSELDLYVTLGGPVNLDQSKQYRLSGSPSTASSTTYRLMGKVTKQDNTYSYIADNTGNGVQLPLSAKAILVYINIKNGISINETFYPMVEEGTTKTSYEPYIYKDYSLNLGSLELCKIGDYQDYIYKENDNWYKYGAIEKYVYNDDLTGFSTAEQYIQALTPAQNIAPSLTKSQINAIALCNIIQTQSTTEPCFNGTSSDSKIRIRITKNYVADYDEYEALCEEKNLTIYFVAYVPTSTQITDETLIAQLEAIYNHLALVKGVNHITITPSDLEPYITLNYMQDLPSKLDNLDSRLSLLE